MKWLPEIIAGLTFYPCGAWLGYILYTFMTPPSITRRLLVIPHVFVIGGAVLAAIILTLFKIVTKRIKFLHFYFLALASVCFLVGGFLLAFRLEYRITAFLGGFAYGLNYVSGISYIHIRSKSKYRVQRIALCHFWLITGTVSSIHYVNQFALRIHGSSFFGYFMLYGGAVSIFLILTNEVLHVLKVFNYKTCLEENLRAADEKKDGFRTGLRPTFIDSSVRPSRETQLKLSIMMLMTKALNGFLFNNIFLVFTLITQLVLLRGIYYFIPHYIMLLGLIIGIILSLSVKPKIMFISISFFTSSSILVGTVLLGYHHFEISAIFFWLFYFFAGMTYFIGDVGIVELWSLQIYELGVAIGVILEQTIIMCTVNHVNWNILFLSGGELKINTGVFISFGMIVCALMAAQYPNTIQKTVLQIQHMILYGKQITKPQENIDIPCRRSFHNNHPAAYPQYNTGSCFQEFPNEITSIPPSAPQLTTDYIISPLQLTVWTSGQEELTNDLHRSSSTNKN